MRELRVEDALLYLDQVKMEFGDRPHIYNEFLDIMKTFKSQQIDTPGVIQRVSALFHGNKRLVLGFNTFLPEGYKIELPLDGSGLAVYREPGRSGVTQITWPGMQQHLAAQQQQQQQQQQSSSQVARMPPRVPTAPGKAQAAHLATLLKGPPAPAPQQAVFGLNPQPPNNVPGRPPPPPSVAPAPRPSQQQQQQQQPSVGQQPVEFGHAINYVTTIKKRFAAHPEIYRKFLEILHTYQKEQRGIKEVLDEVSMLFADHADLLKEFTYFLPDAVQGVAKKQLDEAAKLAEERARLKAAGVKIPAPPALPSVTATAISVTHGVTAESKELASPPPITASEEPLRLQRVPAAHVKKIPFGATQGRSEIEENEICKSTVNGTVSFAPVRPPRRNESNPAQAARAFGRPKCIPDVAVQCTTTEQGFFENIKSHFDRKAILHDSSKPSARKQTPHADFIKCIHLFGAGVLNKDELIQLLRGLLLQGNAPKNAAGANTNSSSAVKSANLLIAELEKVMMGRGPLANQGLIQKYKSKYISHPLRECGVTDTSRNVSPSYWSYPADFVFDEFLGETEKDSRFLNFECFCVSKDWNEKGRKFSKSLEDYDGVKTRHNAHEEVMNRVEDEMYEVDMAIERNKITMRLLEPIAEETTQLREQEEKSGQPIGRLQYKLKPRCLSSIHIGAIARIYGESGDEVIQHLIKNPLVVVPIVHQRMKEKDEEWNSTKIELMKEWKSTLSEHYRGSLNVKTYFHQREVENSVKEERLIEECQGLFVRDPDPIFNRLGLKNSVEYHTDPCPEMSFTRPYLSCKLPSKIPHSEVYDLLVSCVGSDDSLRDILTRVWKDFVALWFRLSLGDDGTNETPCVNFDPGQWVKTTLGDGEILSVEGKSNHTCRYLVHFPFGVGYVKPSAISEVIPSNDTVLSMNDVTPQLMEDNNQVMYGTKNIYIFMRLYTLLATMMSDVKGCCDPSYLAVLLASLRGVVEKDDYDSQCRRVVGETSAQYFAFIPYIVEQCVGAMMNMAKEDYFVQLCHCSQLKLKDINLVQTLSLQVTGTAVYRIHAASDKHIFFSYSPTEGNETYSKRNDFSSCDSEANDEGPELKRLKTEQE